MFFNRYDFVSDTLHWQIKTNLGSEPVEIVSTEYEEGFVTLCGMTLDRDAIVTYHYDYYAATPDNSPTYLRSMKFSDSSNFHEMTHCDKNGSYFRLSFIVNKVDFFYGAYNKNFSGSPSYVYKTANIGNPSTEYSHYSNWINAMGETAYY